MVQPDWGDVAGGPHSHPRAGADLPAPAAAAGPGTENVGFSAEKRQIFPWKTGIFHCREKHAEGVLGIFPNQKKKIDRSHCGMVAPPSNLVGRGVTIDYFSAIK